MVKVSSVQGLEPLNEIPLGTFDCKKGSQGNCMGCSKNFVRPFEGNFLK